MSESRRCTGAAGNGSPCRWPRWRDRELCLNHSARAGDQEAIAEQRERGSRGNAKRAARSTAKRRASCGLRTTDAQLGELERLLVQVEASGESATAKANAVVRIIAEARAILVAAELETENQELRELIVERLPELKRALRVT